MYGLYDKIDRKVLSYHRCESFDRWELDTYSDVLWMVDDKLIAMYVKKFGNDIISKISCYETPHHDFKSEELLVD